MVSSLVVFLIGVLVLAVLIYIGKLFIGMLDLPPNGQQIATLILGLIGLLLLLSLILHVFGGWGGPVVIF